MSVPSINLSALPAPSRNRKDGPSESIESILVKYSDLLNITEKQRDKLLNLKVNGDYIFKYSNMSFLYEVFSMIKVLKFDETYKYLSSLNDKVSTDKNITSKEILESPLFEREQTVYQADISRLRDEFQVKVKGLEKCKRCHSWNTENRTNDRQRGGDEGMIYKLFCNDCFLEWTIG